MNLADYSELVVKPYLPETLVSRESWEKLRKLKAHFPSTITDFWGYECRLSAKKDTDILFCINKDQKGFTVDNIANLVAISKDWENIAYFLKKWQSKTDSFSHQINNLWLEFDSEVMEDKSPIPSLFFAPNVRSYEEFVSLYQDFSNTIGLNFDEKTLSFYAHVVTTLPYGAWIPQVGFMLARTREHIRFYVHGLSKEGIIQFLKKNNWKGNLSNLEKIVVHLSQYARVIDLDIDLSEEGISNKIGLECYFEEGALHHPKFRTFLQFLVSTGFCSQEKMWALFSYYGEINSCFSEDMRSFLGDVPLITCRRFVHHIKISYEGDNALEAKVYLGLIKEFI